jgi:hypothetical protein
VESITIIVGEAKSVVQHMQNLNRPTTISEGDWGRGLIHKIGEMFLIVTLYLIIIKIEVCNKVITALFMSLLIIKKKIIKNIYL